MRIGVQDASKQGSGCSLTGTGPRDTSAPAEFDFIGFSPEAAEAFLKLQAEDALYRYHADKRLAQRDDLETVSPKHVRIVFKRGRKVLTAVLFELVSAAGWTIAGIGLAVLINGDASTMRSEQILTGSLTFAFGVVLISVGMVRKLAQIKLH